MEDRVRQDLLGAEQICWQRIGRLSIELVDIGRHAEGLPERLDVVALGHLIAGDTNGVAVDAAQVDPKLARLGNHDIGVVRHAYLHGVKEGVVQDIESAATQSFRKNRGQAMDALSDRTKAIGAVIDRVHAGDHGEEHLGRADIRGRLVATNVLLARLQGKSQCGGAIGINGDTNKPPGHHALKPIADRHVGGVWATEANRHAVPLHRANGDIRTHRGGRSKQDERQRIGGQHGERVALVQCSDRRAPVANPTIGTRVLQERTDDFAVGQTLFEVRHYDGDSQRRSARLDNSDRLGQCILVNEKQARVLLGVTEAERHRLGRCRRLIEQRCIRHRQPRQVGDDRLIVEQRLEATLGNLGLIRRVGRVPGGVLEHLPQDDLRRMGVVVAQPDHLRHHLIALTDLAQLCEHLDLGRGGRHINRLAHPNRAGDGCLLEGIQRGVAKLGKHRCLFVGAGSDVATTKRYGVLEFDERRARPRRLLLLAHALHLSHTRPHWSHTP